MAAAREKFVLRIDPGSRIIYFQRAVLRDVFHNNEFVAAIGGPKDPLGR